MTTQRTILAGFAALLMAAPAVAEEAISQDLAESRLRGCLLAGSSSTGQSQLEAAVIRDMRVAVATKGLKGNAAEDAKTRAIRALNAEIAQAVANFTGLQL